MDSIKLSQTVFNLIKNINISENISDTLEEILCHLNDHNKPPKDVLLINDLKAYRKEFEQNYYYDIFSLILDKFNINWDNKICDGTLIEDIFKKIILNGPSDDTLLCLSSSILYTKNFVFKVQLIKHLQDLLEKNCVEKIFNKYCILSVYSANKNSISPHDQLCIEELNKINQIIVSLPDKILINNLSIDLTFFYRKKYYYSIGYNIVMSLQKVYSNLKSNKDCSVFPISNLLSKINLTGNSEIIWDYLLTNLCGYYKDDYLWRRIIQKVIFNIDDLSINSILLKIIQLVPDYIHLNYIIGNLPTNKKFVVFGFHKMLLHSYSITNSTKLMLYIGFKEELVLHYKDIFLKFLELWSNPNGLKRRPIEQSLYICKMIMLCIAINKKKSLDYNEQKQVISRYFLDGMPNYLSSLNCAIQEMGMFVAEYLIFYIEDGKANLNFEIKRTSISEELTSIMTIIDESIISKIKDINIDKIELLNIEDNSYTEPYNNEIDSDDELPAFPSSTFVKKEKPKYISDCVNHLIKSEDPNYVRECLLAIGELTEGKPEASEICVELCKILLHLEDKFALENFIQLRFDAMVILTISYPLLISNFLTNQFFESEYSIRHRLDILDVILTSAIKLSSIETINQSLDETKNDSSSATNQKVLDWREIVNQRIEKKTRRFCSSQSSHKKPSNKNRFSKFAGNFFYPLMKDFDKKTNCLDIVSRDYLVAQKLLYTLSSVMNCSMNTPDVGHMAASLIEFSLCFKAHPEPGVIMSLMCCLGSAIIALNEGSLLIYIEEHIDSVRDFLLVVLNMENSECVRLALEVKHVLNESMKQYALKLMN